MSTVNCISCGKPIADNDKRCTSCGTHRPLPGDNSCINPACPRYKIPVKNDVSYCGDCGKPTRIGVQIEKMI